MNMDKISAEKKEEAASFMVNAILHACTGLMEDCGVLDDTASYDLDREQAQLIYIMLCKAREIGAEP